MTSASDSGAWYSNGAGFIGSSTTGRGGVNLPQAPHRDARSRRRRHGRPGAPIGSARCADEELPAGDPGRHRRAAARRRRRRRDPDAAARTRSSRSPAARGCSRAGASTPRTTPAARCPTIDDAVLDAPPATRRRARRWRRPGSPSTRRRWCGSRTGRPAPTRRRGASRPGSSSRAAPDGARA